MSVGVTSAQRAIVRSGVPRAGATPGTEEWVAILRGRSFSMRQRLAAIRAEPDGARRRTMIDALAADSRREQQAFADDVRFLGGRVLRHHWLLNACTIEIPRIRVEAIAGHPSAAVLSPNEERKPAFAGIADAMLPAPIGGSRSPDNHNVDAAHTILGHKGQNANIAFFDTGVDLDQSGAVGNGGALPDPDHHRAFLTGTVSRILHSEKVGPIASAIDCNDVDPWCPGSFPLQHPSAQHGTGVAAIAAGSMDPDTTVPPPPFPPPPLFQEGHAPGAKILSFSISLLPTSSIDVWPTTTDVVLDAVERLMGWVLANPPSKVDVLNISYSLWPDPDHPTQIALDLLERDFDVLVIAAASNEADATGHAPGFTNGLTVGNVHKWFHTTAWPSARYPNRDSSRGPLQGDGDRYYPDVCATGASVAGDRGLTVTQIVMPMLDDRHQPVPPLNSCRSMGMDQQWYDSVGTSMASPQVAGAAAIYRAERPSATALETKAAVLLATVDPLQAADTPMALHTYIDRNATGVGYVRDDLLARYAKRESADNAGASNVVLTPQTPSVSVTYGGLTSGTRYAVAIAWPRLFPSDETPTTVPWPNVDLEVLTTGGTPTVIARSDSLRNTYERLVFKATGDSATIRVTAVEFQGANAVPVFIAYRKVTAITVTVDNNPVSVESRRSVPGFVKVVPQQTACSHAVPDQTVSRTLPASYRQAYGSGAFYLGSAPFSGSAFASLPIGTSQLIMENIFAASELGSGGSPFTIRGLSLRSWSPFKGCDGTLNIEEIILYRRAHTAGTTLTTLLHGTTRPDPTIDPDAIRVALNLSVPVHEPSWNARGYDTWPIILPFNIADFAVDPNKALGIWIKFGSGGNVCPNPTNSYGVDYIDDRGPGVVLPYAIYHPWLGTMGVDGAAAVIGLLEGTTAARNVQLDVFGFPRSGANVLFQIRQGTPSSLAVIGLGSANPNVISGNCLLLTSADLLVTGGLSTSSMGNATWSFTWPGGLLHQHIFAQAVTASGLYSNGLRLTIGGVVAP